jgi:hypothetical protein
MSRFAASAVRVSAARDITGGHYRQQEVSLVGITGSKRYHWWALPAARDITGGHYRQQEISLLGITGSKRYHWWALPAARDITAGHYRQQEISLLGITGNKRYHCWALTQKVISAANMTGLLKTSNQSVRELWA